MSTDTIAQVPTVLTDAGGTILTDPAGFLLSFLVAVLLIPTPNSRIASVRAENRAATVLAERRTITPTP